MSGMMYLVRLGRVFGFLTFRHGPINAPDLHLIHVASLGLDFGWVQILNVHLVICFYASTDTQPRPMFSCCLTRIRANTLGYCDCMLDTLGISAN